ncbi:MAG: nickel-dependent lactate racemase [Alicyclobacillus sp.]|nr:nickel-dependent lactate racemase [Alicyclobacillus sp.]
MKETIRRLLDPIPLPRGVRVRQRFDDTHLADPQAALRAQLHQPGCLDAVQRGQRVAVAVGSRGIACLAELTKTLVDALVEVGALPFIVPSMGSHGGATAEGQKAVLARLGIDEAGMGVPVRSSMEVVEIGRLENGLPVYVDRLAATEADAIVVINRVKPHTAFRGPVESGLQKMLAIGLGKQRGAEACHQLGFQHMATHVPQMAQMILARLPVVFGVAVIENAYDQVCRVAVVPAKEIPAREPALLEEARMRMPRLLFDPIDVLVIDYIGKNISGDGADPNITGRYPTPYAHGGPEVNKMVVLDLTDASEGNANGVGTADFTTQRLMDKADWTATYMNGLTSTVVAPTKIPTVLDNDRYAIQAAIKTCNILDYERCRLVRIRDTLHLGEVWISEALLPEALAHPAITVLDEVAPMRFDEAGWLVRDWDEG